jgi:hypothetical protein
VSLLNVLQNIISLSLFLWSSKPSPRAARIDLQRMEHDRIPKVVESARTSTRTRLQSQKRSTKTARLQDTNQRQSKIILALIPLPSLDCRCSFLVVSYLQWRSVDVDANDEEYKRQKRQKRQKSPGYHLCLWCVLGHSSCLVLRQTRMTQGVN